MRLMRYPVIMRTTLSIADELLASAKVRARNRGLTLGQLVEQALQAELSRARAQPDGPVLPVHEARGGVHPGVDLTSNRAVRELLDGDLPLDKRRT